MERKVITMIPITKGQWAVPQHDTNDWDNDPKGAGMYFMELVFDWTLFPKGTQGKLYAEIMGAHVRSETNIEIRLAYQLEAAEWIPVEGSNIKHEGSNRWQLLESEWFDLPHDPGVSCLWIQGQSHNKGVCHVALVTLVIAEVVKGLTSRKLSDVQISDEEDKRIEGMDSQIARDIGLKELTEEEISTKVDEWTGLHTT